MKIVFLSRYQHDTQRGAETFVQELSSKLNKDYQVDIFGGKDADSLKKILQGKYDVVVPINGRLQSLKVSLGRFLGGYKILITGHSGIGRDDIWNLAVTRPDVFVVLTEAALDNWQTKLAHLISWQTKLVKIPNGIDLEKFKSTGDKLRIDLPKPIVLSVGALTWYKHHERVIEAVAKLGAGSVVIVGGGPEQKRLEKLGREKLPNRMRIMQVDYDQMPKVYRSADLFTLASWEREAFGLVYLEAMASGLPVVAPNDASRQEIVGEAGLLVDVTNPTTYAQAITQALATDWGNKPRLRASQFSWAKIIDRYEKVFNELINS